MLAPTPDLADAVLRRIHDAIRACAEGDFALRATRLAVDYFLPGSGVVLEVDERQHFTSNSADGHPTWSCSPGV